MGWWQISSVEAGQINFEHAPNRILANALPDRDSDEVYYNGDGPADVLGDAINTLLEKGVKPITLKETFNHPETFSGEIAAIVNKALEDVVLEYRAAWNRDPFPEEMQAAINFVTNPYYNGLL